MLTAVEYATDLAAFARRRIFQGKSGDSLKDSQRPVLRTRSPLSREAFTSGLVPLRELCEALPRVAIIGPRGAGRSTFLCELALDACARLSAGEPAEVPVWVVAGEPGRFEDGVRAAEQQLAELAPGQPGTLWLVDATDVPAGQAAGQCCTIVGQLCERLENARCVVAIERQSALCLRDRYGFRVVEVEPFTLQQAREFLVRDGASHAARALEHSVGLRELARYARGLSSILDTQAKLGRPAELLEVAAHAAAAEPVPVTESSAAFAQPGIGEGDLLRLLRAAHACRERIGTRGGVAALRALGRSVVGAELLVQSCGTGDALQALGALVDQALCQALEPSGDLDTLIAASTLLGCARRTHGTWVQARQARHAEAVVPLLAAAVTSPVLSTVQRLAAADALGVWGDPRVGDSPLESVAACDGEERVLIGRQLVTVQQYACFAADGGYAAPQWWSREGSAFLAEANLDGPAQLDEQIEHPNRPIVYVSWFEAEAYCRWLSHRSAARVSLVTLVQWQAAGSHPDGPFPWGAAEPTPEMANYNQWLGHASPVGMFPGGASRSGHCDLSGNVWEWCRDVEGPLAAVAGGGWFSQSKYIRSDYSYRFDRRNRFHDLGFRVAVLRQAREDGKS